MSTTPLIRESVVAARRRLAEGREKIRRQHQAGSPGIQVCTHLTELVDEAVIELHQAALSDLGLADDESLRDNVALVALAGYGRRELAPFSDVDLLLLHTPAVGREIAPLAQRMMRDLFDAGLVLGQSVRTPRDACRLALQDATICTSQTESRLLLGSEGLFGSFVEQFQRFTRRRLGSLLPAIEHARRQERAQFGETVYLLRPNVKRSRGGLRDIQLLRWVGFICYGVADPQELQLRGYLTKDEQRALRNASEFLLRLRNELHFRADRAADVLDRPEQVRLAEMYGYEGSPAVLPVERFMQDYFRHTSAVRRIAGDFVANARPGSRWAGLSDVLLGVASDGGYRVTPRHIAATRSGLAKLRTDPAEVLHLANLANLHNKRIAQPTWNAVRAAVPYFTDEPNDQTAAKFLALLSQPARLGELLRRLHDLGILEKIVPAFRHARGLLQFNEYHKYTVDEHCLLAVERATQFLGDPGVLGRVYQQIKSKRTLHLALLLHDLGKGFPEDHSEVGREIAEQTAHRLRLPLRETETLKFLVHKHLAMAHIALRRDTSDENLLVRFAVEVGSPEALDMLYVLTAADIAAVGPGVWNQWKAEVLADFYVRTRQHLAGDAPARNTAGRLAERRDAIRRHLPDDDDAEWFDRQIATLPASSLFGISPEKMAADLRELHTLAPLDVRARAVFLPEMDAVEYVVQTHEQVAPGIFHKLTGALSSKRLQILSAQINTLADGLVLDRFWVLDPDFSGPPPPQRITEVCAALTASLRSANGEAPRFAQLWQTATSDVGSDLGRLPTCVRTDNATSDRYTIIDVFAHDRVGLLYTITRTLFELGLSVSLAKIGTHLDQVVDVFYVTDSQGRQITDDEALQRISAGLLSAIESMPA